GTGGGDRGERAGDDADEQRREKAAQRRTAEEQQRHHYDRSHHLGHDGARERLVDGLIEYHVRGRAAVALEALADAVEHHHRVIQRVADDGEDGSDHRQIEGHLAEREEADHQDRIVQYRENRTERQPPGVETERDVQKYPEQREEQRPHGAHLELV